MQEFACIKARACLHQDMKGSTWLFKSAFITSFRFLFKNFGFSMASQNYEKELKVAGITGVLPNMH